MEGRSLESIEGIRLLAKVRSHIRDYQDTSVSSPVTDTAVSISSADESSTQTVPTTLVVCGVFGIATTIAFFAAQRAYFETVYEANHPQVIYSKEKRRQSRPIIRCVNFSLSSFDLLHKTAEAFGIAANFTSDQLTHYSTAGKSYFRTAESSKQNPSSIPGGKMDAHNSERKESISKWGREDWRGSSSGGGRLANDCRLRVLEAHHRFALDGYLKLKRKTEITSNDEMEHFQGMYEDLKLPTSPCLTEAVRVLIDGADPDVFLSLDTISRKCKGSSISIHHTVALSTDGTATRVFSSVLQGKVTDKWLKEIRSRQTPEQQTKPLPLEVLFEPSTNSFFPSAFGISGNMKENVWIQLNNILRYVYFNCPYDGLENDEESIIGENNVLTGPVNFWKSLKDYIFPNLQRRDRIISELFRKSVSKHNSTGDTIDILDGIMGWNCLSNETIAPRKTFHFYL